MATEGVCSDTVNGWLWYCDEHDTHGNADSEGEARRIGFAHVDYFVDEHDADPCEIIVWYRTEHERTES